MKLKHRGRTDKYSEMRTEAVRLKEKNDCAVVALALATGKTYAEARDALAFTGRKHQEGAFRDQQQQAVELLGFYLEPVSLKDIQHRFPARYVKLGRGVTTYSPRRFPEAFAHLKGKYLLWSSRHVSAMTEGEVHDWASEKSKRVLHMWEVIARNK